MILFSFDPKQGSGPSSAVYLQYTDTWYVICKRLLYVTESFHLTLLSLSRVHSDPCPFIIMKNSVNLNSRSLLYIGYIKAKSKGLM